MLLESPRCRTFQKAYYLLTVAIVISSIIGRAFSALNSITILLLFLTWLVEGRFKEKRNRLKKEPLFYILLAFYMLYILSIFHSKDLSHAKFIAQRELPLIILPVILLSKDHFSGKEISNIFRSFVFAAFIWMCVATLASFKSFMLTGDAQVFFYHSLVKPIGSTAIYASMFCIIALQLVETLQASSKIKRIFYISFTVWLILLSSKMFLCIYATLLLVHIFSYVHKRHRLAAALISMAVFIVLCLASGPLRQRFADIGKFNPDYLTETKFNNSIYFDGLSLRLLYIRYSLEIMKEQRHYFWGVGTGDAACLLKDKIRQYHMNTGDGIRPDDGYLRYSFHNVYLETLVSLGAIGLAIVLLLYGYIGYLGIKTGTPLLIGLCIIMVLSSCSDVIVINSQEDVSMIMGILCLCLMPLRFPKGQRNIQDIVTAN